MNEKILSIYLVLGFFVVLGYVTTIRSYPFKEIWTNRGRNGIGNKLRYLYTFMIILSFIAGTYLVYYLTEFTNDSNDFDDSTSLIYAGSVIFLLFSVIWAFVPFFKYATFVLFMVFVGSVIILAGVCKLDNGNAALKTTAIVASSILMIQTGLFDFGIWNGLILK